MPTTAFDHVTAWRDNRSQLNVGDSLRPRPQPFEEPPVNMLALSIHDGHSPIATIEVVPALDENGEDSGRFAPLVEFRVLRYQLLPGYDALRPILRSAGDATRLFGRPAALSEVTRLDAKQAMRAAEVIEARLRLQDERANPIDGRVTMFRESDFGGLALHAISVALPPEFVQLSQSAQSNQR